MNTLSNIGGALLIAFVLAGLGLQLDGPSDIQHEQDKADALRLAQDLDALDRRMERNAALLCIGQVGRDAHARWTADRELVCIPRRDDALVATTTGRPANTPRNP